MENLNNHTVQTQKLWLHNEEDTPVTVLPEKTLNMKNLEAIKPRTLDVSRLNENGMGDIVNIYIWFVTNTGRE